MTLVPDGAIGTASTTPAASFTEQGASTVFGSTSLPEGTIHIFRETGLHITPPPEPSTSSPPKPHLDRRPAPLPDVHADGTLLAVLAVPSYMTPPDFLTFIGPAVQSIIHLRMIRYALGALVLKASSHSI